MKLHELAPTPGSKKRRMRVGRGDGSNRIPKRGFNSGVKEVFNVINVSTLAASFKAGDVVDDKAIRMAGLIGKAEAPLKILGNGEIAIALTVKANKFSAAAKAKIEAAGGKCETV